MFYVAATRAMHRLTITYWDKPSRFIPFPNPYTVNPLPGTGTILQLLDRQLDSTITFPAAG